MARVGFISNAKTILISFKNNLQTTSGADAIKKFTPSLGIPYLGV